MSGKKKLDDSRELCPHCGTQLQGQPVPEKFQADYGATHFSRKIGLYDRKSDRVTQWQCPDCKKPWPV